MKRAFPRRLGAALLAAAPAVSEEPSALLDYQLIEERPIRHDLVSGHCSRLRFEGSDIGWVAEVQAASVGLVFRRCIYEDDDDSPRDWGYRSSEVYLLKPAASPAPLGLPGIGWFSAEKVCDRYLAYRQQRPERQVVIADLASMTVLAREPMFKPPCHCDVAPLPPVWVGDCAAVEFPEDEIRLTNPAGASAKDAGNGSPPVPARVPQAPAPGANSLRSASFIRLSSSRPTRCRRRRRR